MATVPPRTESPVSPPAPMAYFQGLDAGALEANADALLSNLDRFLWPEMPERPEALIQTDQELWTAWRKVDRGEKVSREDKEQLHLLGHWRSAVLHIEAVTAGKLLTMVGVLRRLEQSERRADDAEALRAHILRQFCCVLPEPCPEMGEWLRGWCDHFSRNTKLLARHLRRMTRPPAAEGWKKAAPTHQGGYAEDDGD